ncbi:hypothetical protein [Candidatus Enterococcus mansonii]|uniref:Uncharacterized protein n=2 Tax=Candidatus Enterococcus mansonii TaxID=1834181 RepID=A0ABU8IGR8_9ENTE
MTNTFTLDWSGVVYKDEEINEQLIKKIIDDFNIEEDSFLVLQPESPIKNSLYMQVQSPLDENIPIEIRFIYTNGVMKHFRNESLDKQTIYQYLVDYWAKEEVPNIESWIDISHQFNTFSNRIIKRIKDIFLKEKKETN